MSNTRGGWTNDFLKQDEMWSGSSTNIGGDQNAPITIDALSGQVHELNYHIREIEKLCTEIDRAAEMRISMDQCEQKVDRMKIAREQVKTKLKNFVEQMKAAERNGTFNKSSLANRQFKKIQEGFLKNQEDSQAIIARSMNTEKKLLTRKMDELAEHEKMLEDEDVDDYLDSRGAQQRVKQQLSLSKYDANNIETEKAITKEKLKDLKRLESEMDDITHCYVDFKEILLDQEDGIDEMHNNVREAQEHVDGSVSNLKAANAVQKQGGKVIFMLVAIVLIVGCLCGAAIFLMLYF